VVTVNPAIDGSNSACPTIVESELQPHSSGDTFEPNQLIITPDSTKAFVTSTARTGSLLAYNVGTGTVSTITLAGPNASTAGTTTGGMTLDSKTLFVGGTDNNVHVIDVASGSDTSQIDVGFTPELVAVRPH
jgi:hypothetical protein